MVSPAPDDARTDFTAAARSSEFQALKRSHRSFVLPLSVAFLVWYFAYVLLAAYAHDLMATPVFGAVNLGLLLGLAQFVTTFAITMAYVSFANRRLDPAAAALREHLAAEQRPGARRVAGGGE